MTVVPILLYHSIAESASPAFQPWTVPAAVLDEHLHLLASAGYQALTISELTAAMSRQRELPARSVALTFDDGFEDFHTTALPLLERHGLASTLYVTTGHVGGTARWLHRQGEGGRRMVGWDGLRDVAARGVEIGAHTRTHPRLDELPARRSREEIVGSKRALEDELQRSVRTFAYPHGYHGPRVRQQVVDAGFDSATAVKHAMSSEADDVFALARIIVYPETTAHRLQLLLDGEGLMTPPFAERWRTKAWRWARRSRAVARGALTRGDPWPDG